MKVASSGSRRAISSASRRMRAHTGSTFSSAPALTCRWAIIVSAHFGPEVSLAQFDWATAVYGDGAANVGDALTTIRRAKGAGLSRCGAARTGTPCRLAKSSGLLREKAQHRRLERLISHRKHVISPGDLERPAGRQQRRKLLRRTRDHVVAADRDQHRRANPRDFFARQGLARATDTGGERPEVGFGLLGKGAESASHGIADIRERGSLERLRDALRQPNAIDEMNAQSAEHRPAQARRIGERKKRGDARPHGVTHHVGTGEIEMIEQRA